MEIAKTEATQDSPQHGLSKGQSRTPACRTKKVQTQDSSSQKKVLQFSLGLIEGPGCARVEVTRKRTIESNQWDDAEQYWLELVPSVMSLFVVNTENSIHERVFNACTCRT